jgi:MFS family permease
VRFAAFSAIDDLVPWYGLYAVLFADTGLSDAQIASLFAIWSLTSVALEVPSGALADVVSRRRLLAVAALVRGAGFALWTFAPSYPAFAAGFVLWGIGGALTSGTVQALVHDELVAIGADRQYQRLSAGAETAGLVGAAVGTLAAVPLLTIGGYLAVGVASVAACGLGAAVALTFPRRPRLVPVEGPAGIRAWLVMLRTGVREAAGVRMVRRLVLLGALLPGMTALDEFFPLVALDLGAAVTLVPVLVMLPMLGQIIGGATAAWQRSGLLVGMAVGAGGILIAGGAVSGSVWWGFLAISVGYGALQHAMVVADARLQAAVRSQARATVTSVAGLGAEVAAMLMYAAWGAAAAPLGQGGAVAAVAAPLVGLGVLAALWLRLPNDRPARADGGPSPMARM